MRFRYRFSVGSLLLVVLVVAAVLAGIRQWRLSTVVLVAHSKGQDQHLVLNGQDIGSKCISLTRGRLESLGVVGVVKDFRLQADAVYIIGLNGRDGGPARLQLRSERPTYIQYCDAATHSCDALALRSTQIIPGECVLVPQRRD